MKQNGGGMSQTREIPTRQWCEMAGQGAAPNDEQYAVAMQELSEQLAALEAEEA